MEKAQQSISDGLSCPICLEIFEDPRNLSCHHTFCFKCLAKLLKHGKITCGTCRVETQVSNIASIPKNYVVGDIVELFSKSVIILTTTNTKLSLPKCDECEKQTAEKYCEKCAAHFCGNCLKSTHSGKVLSQHQLIQPSEENKEKNIFCSKHDGEVLKYWCLTDKQLVCRDCLLFEHKNHEYLDLIKAANDSKSSLKLKLDNVQPNKKLLIESQMKIEDQLKKQEENYKQVKEKLEKIFKQIIQDFEMKHQKEMKSLKEHHTLCLESLKGFEIHESLAKHLINNQNNYQVLKMVNKVEQFFEDVKTLKLQTKDIVKLELSDQFLENFQKEFSQQLQFKSIGLGFDPNYVGVVSKAPYPTLSNNNQRILNNGWNCSSLMLPNSKKKIVIATSKTSLMKYNGPKETR